MNIEMAYLLGMITGNGEIQRGTESTRILIEIPHKKLETEFERDVRIYVKASIADIREIIEPLLGTSMEFTQNANVSFLSFSKRNEDYLMREILRYVKGATSHENIRISSEVFEFNMDERKYFVKGFADVTGYIRESNYAFVKKQNRVYFEIPQNWYLVVDFCNLLKSIDIPVQNIDWGHPNMRDGNLTKYKEGKVDYVFSTAVERYETLPSDFSFSFRYYQDRTIKLTYESDTKILSNEFNSLVLEVNLHIEIE